MDIYVTDTTTNTQTVIPVIPESITAKGEANFLSYDILNVGEVKIPNGENLTSYAWDNGLFPSQLLRKHPLVHGTWQDPQIYQTRFNGYKTAGTPLKLLITGTPVNDNVYISSFEVTYQGIIGAQYSIEFLADKDIKVTTEVNPSLSSTKMTTVTLKRATAPAPKTYTVVSGDSLWKIAEKKLGSGAKWTAIYNANKSKIKNPSLIYPGQILTLP